MNAPEPTVRVSMVATMMLIRAHEERLASLASPTAPGACTAVGQEAAVLRKNAADGVNGVVARHTLLEESGHRTNGRFVGFGNLVLHRGVNHGVNRQLDARGLVMSFHEQQSLLLIERKPPLRIGCDRGVVGLHAASSGRYFIISPFAAMAARRAESAAPAARGANTTRIVSATSRTSAAASTPLSCSSRCSRGR